jgi:Tol biopolymer transport system component
MSVETGRRTIHHRSPTSLQAPNWTPDGEALIYNSGGLLYRFDLATKTPKAIDTGFADDNNNDHVLSPDGTRLGISHHAEAHDGASIIYTVPIEGGHADSGDAKRALLPARLVA